MTDNRQSSQAWRVVFGIKFSKAGVVRILLQTRLHFLARRQIIFSQRVIDTYTLFAGRTLRHGEVKVIRSQLATIT